MSTSKVEVASCIPERPLLEYFNPLANIPCGVSVENICSAMQDFTEFLHTINSELHRKGMLRLEDTLMPANFSSIVGEFFTTALPRHCLSVAKNTYHNGHPDLLPAGKHPQDSAQHAGADGIEVKASRYQRGWQGHNAEDVWLMVLVFKSGRPVDLRSSQERFPFRFLAVYGASLSMTDWKFDGRGETSRRTITATVTPSGYEKMTSNWIYRSPLLTGET